jgi:hypothetical protein
MCRSYVPAQALQLALLGPAALAAFLPLPPAAARRWRKRRMRRQQVAHMSRSVSVLQQVGQLWIRILGVCCI